MVLPDKIVTAANRLNRFDGVESLSQIIGAALSPILFRWSGFYGNFMLRALFTLSALLYTIFLVEEPLRRRASQVRTSSL